jgi:hypothetical protein
MENRSELARIGVRQGEECIELAPGTPTLSSAGSPYEGSLFERHFHGAYKSFASSTCPTAKD